MEMDAVLLEEKIDQLTLLLEVQNKRLEALESNGANHDLLLSKLDAINQHMEDQIRRQAELDELKRDLIPVANHMIKLSIDELAEISTEFQLEDLLFLLKRLLRDTHLLMDLLERLEGTTELFDELQVIGNQVFHHSVAQLDQMEREGYFVFAQEGWRIVERIVNEFSDEDVKALGDNIVTILTTVRNLTQPEIMALTNNALQAFQNEPPDEQNITIWALMRDLSDPKVRKGMARLLNLVKVLADQPSIQQN